MLSRRAFNKSLVTLAFSGLANHLNAMSRTPSNWRSSPSISAEHAFGKLVDDPEGRLDLPPGFSYRVISSYGQVMDDGLPVPNDADGMGCIPLDEERVALVRNHELMPDTAFTIEDEALRERVLARCYAINDRGQALPGGTSTLIFNTHTGQLERQFMSLTGTMRNCAGGVTPWGSWLTCEENTDNASSENSKDHGFVFEVPASATELVKAEPLTAMGRFNHEAACVDPRTGIVYMTEDRDDSLFYRFIPNLPGKLAEGGKLQALAIVGRDAFDTRNWEKGTKAQSRFTLGESLQTHWVDLEDVTSPNDDLRNQGAMKGAAIFARGEGVQWAGDSLYFCCTSGGRAELGQIMHYTPSSVEGTPEEAKQPGELSLFVESDHKATFDYGDNITIGPNGHLFVCEDQYSVIVNNKLKGVTPSGELYDFGRVRWQTEPAGICFSPDGKWMFVNLYSPATTLAITGPWEAFGRLC